VLSTGTSGSTTLSGAALLPICGAWHKEKTISGTHRMKW
jgi:hypothetical protein